MEHKAFDKERMSRFWGKVKTYVANAISGLYTKPSGGIPKTDLSSDVQTSLGKADTALQSHQDISGKQDVISDLTTIRDNASAGATAYQKPSGGIPKTDLASDVQTSLGKADTALQSFTEQDPTVPSWAKASSKPSYTASEVGALPDNTPIPSKTSDLVNDSGFLTQHQDVSGKQDVLVSGTNIKTINNTSLLGSGNISLYTNTAYEIRGTVFSPKSKTDIYRYNMVFQYSEDEMICSATSYSNGDNKDLTTLDFDPFGGIYYNTATANAGANLNGSNLYMQGYYDFRYAFKIVADPLVAGKSVYLKCEPLVDGSNNRTGRVRFATGQPIVQTLPTTADGYVYIFLGWAALTTHIFLCTNHPIYEYRNGGVKLWIGD